MNYDELQTRIALLNTTKNHIDKQRGGRHRDIDKCGFGFGFADRNTKLRPSGHHGWPEAHVTFGAYSGTYGSSGCSNDMTASVAEYVVKALASLEHTIIDEAIKHIDDDIKELAKQAKDEATQILALALDNKETPNDQV